MENGLIIGRNYWNKEIRCTERYGNNNPMQDNEIGQQSEKIWDKRVSRIHLLLTESDNHNYPYRLKLLNTNNVVYVNGVPITEILIKGDEKVELGCDEEGNHYPLNIQRAIKDLESLDIQIGGSTILPPKKGSKNKTQLTDPNPMEVNTILRYKRLFRYVTIILIVLLFLTFISKTFQTAHNILLFLLTLALAGDIYMYTKIKELTTSKK